MKTLITSIKQSSLCPQLKQGQANSPQSYHSKHQSQTEWDDLNEAEVILANALKRMPCAGSVLNRHKANYQG
jgi:hypothetical protein